MANQPNTLAALEAEIARLMARLEECNRYPVGSKEWDEGARIVQQSNVIDAEIESIKRTARYAEVSGALGFHWTNGRFFKRLDDGSVRVVQFNRWDDEPKELMVIDANSWCSIMCAVSGDYGPGRWDEARRFHGVAEPAKVAA